MRTLRMTWLSIGPRPWLLAAMLLALGGCRTYYVFPPVEVSTETVSPVYRLAIVNQRASELALVPAEEFAEAAEIVIPPGATREVSTVVVRRLNVGGSSVPQVLDGPFVVVESAGFGELDIRATSEPDCPGCEPCDLRVDVRHPGWLAGSPRQRGEDPPLLRVCVAECDPLRVVFREGPATDECP